MITVMGINDCGNGEFSDAYATDIYTSQGLNEYAADGQLIIYPNPTNGKITIGLPSQKAFTGDLSVTETGGSVVYSVASLTITAGGKITLDLGQLSKGIYSRNCLPNPMCIPARLLLSNSSKFKVQSSKLLKV